LRKRNLKTNYQQAVAMRHCKPWEQSTGPRTPAGKSRVSQDSVKHGLTTAAALAEQKAIKKMINDAAALSQVVIDRE
jgi:hypothetical protein